MAKFLRTVCILISAVLICGMLCASCVHREDRGEDSESESTEVQRVQTVVVIDAGHGGEDGGASGKDGTLEKDLNLSIALCLAEMLRGEGIQVRLTREDDTLLYDRNSDYEGQKKRQDMAKRLEITESYEDAVFVSIHMNSFPQAKYRGLQVYYSPNSPRSELLARGIQQGVRTNLQPENDRQIKPSGGNIYLLDKPKCPAVLVECGFLSNPEECALLNDEAYRQRLCTTLMGAISAFLRERG